MTDFIATEKSAAPTEFEIEVSDPALNPVPEVEEFLDGLAKLNAQKVKFANQNIYRLDEWTRNHSTVGLYTVLVVSEFDTSGVAHPVMIVTFVDKSTGLPLANKLNVDIKKTTNTLRAKGLMNYNKRRGLQLKAAKSTKLQVRFTAPDDSTKAFNDLKKRLGE